jgi:hypothetical protein
MSAVFGVLENKKENLILTAIGEWSVNEQNKLSN